ncbi:hypothetical protein C7E18_09715, partial [Stenotrophomonas maltophilia]
MKDLFAAVCLVAVLEGLFLFVAPFAWKRMAEPPAGPAQPGPAQLRR